MKASVIAESSPRRIVKDPNTGTYRKIDDQAAHFQQYLQVVLYIYSEPITYARGEC
jgi:hypothetical protein